MATVAQPPQRPYTPPPPRRRTRAWIPNLILALLILLLCVGIAAGIALASLTQGLPSIGVLDDPNALGFKTAQIFDRSGQLLWEISDPSGGKRTVVHLQDISQDAINATLAAEDAHFYDNPGFDPVATLRSAWIDVSGQGTTGASTITQQLVRNAVLDPNEAHQNTPQRKLREIILAVQVDRHYSKDQILEMYLNRVYYGNQSYGIEAAAEGYFGKSAHDLDLAEASLVAGLVQSPSQYDPTRHDVARTDDGIPVQTKDRQRYVLEQMAAHGMITEDQARAAYAEPLTIKPRTVDLKAPHWVMYVRDLLEQQFGDRTLYQAGLKVYTTLDLNEDQAMQQVLQANKDVIAQQGGDNAALIAVDPRTGEILAFQGSLDYNDDSIDGQVNVLTSERQPGSSIKPVIYAASFLKGWAPGTSIDDVPTCWQDAPGHQWCPNNFDNQFHGQTTVRSALGNSINIPAVKTLEFVTLPTAVDLATRMGITTWGPDSGKTLGLSLTLGGAEVRPIDMAQVYATFANNGLKVPLVALRQVVDASGNVLYDYHQPQGEQVLDPRAAYMITNILSDPLAKLFTYGRNTPLILPDRPAASKTGTTDNYRDTWTDGYTPNLAIVVWVGNTDGHPMNQALSTMTAGKIWPQAMQASFTVLGLQPADFPRPDGLVEQQVCGDTALRPGEPPCRQDLFIQGQAPPTPAPTVVATAQTTAVVAPPPTSVPADTAVPATPAPQATAAPAPAVQPAAAPQPAPAAPRTQPTPPPAPTAPPAIQPTVAPKPAATAPPKPAAPTPAPKPGG
ncbi:MAG: transglycosylase domain-containing protein [Chloroflexi bacterium]|nr:transglycosylase domain-containing protein [Chloroflexota bacterium]